MGRGQYRPDRILVDDAAMNNRRPRFARHLGVSLIELMVALAIGTVLVLGLVQVFAASRAAYQMSEGMARVQENARFAMDFLQRDIRMAGHFGCVNDQAHFVQDSNEPVDRTAAEDALDFRFTIQGFEAADTAPNDSVTLGNPPAGWDGAAPFGDITSLTPAPVAGSDIIVLRYFNPTGTPVTEVGASPTTLTIPPIFPSGTPSPAPPDGWPSLTEDGVANPTLFGIADCSQADVFPATGIAGGTLTTSDAIITDLQARYNPHPAGQTRLYRANSIVYYVGLSTTSGEPALFRARADSSGAYTNEELVEGVESLQLLYGRDESTNISATSPPVGNITSLATAQGVGATVAEWRRVGLVQVGMLVRSPNRALAQEPGSDAANPRVLGVEFEPAAANDTRYRATYEATIAVRNRLFGN